MSKNSESLPLPDKKIPVSVMLIGTFEIAVALLGIIVLVLVGQSDATSAAILVLLVIYGTIGAGLWAIQEWARFTNVVLHLIAIPYSIYMSLVFGSLAAWQTVAQVVIAIGIVYALTRPEIRFKFQTVVPKKKQ